MRFSLKWIAVLVLFASATAFGQTKQVTSYKQTWAGYFNQTRFSKHWGLWFDGQVRTKDDFVDDLSQILIRPGLTYYVSDVAKLTAGYGYIRIYPMEPKLQVTQTEHRPWQQFQWHTKYARLRTMQYVRLEERYRQRILNDSTLGSNYQFNFRARYNFLLQAPLSGTTNKGDFSFILNDEVLVNFGKQVVNNYFDQNRFFVGLAYHVNSHDNLQFGYLNVFQQLPAGNRYRAIHAARILYFHNLDLRKKNKQP